jgi:hypothetical protein
MKPRYIIASCVLIAAAVLGYGAVHAHGPAPVPQAIIRSPQVTARLAAAKRAAQAQANHSRAAVVYAGRRYRQVAPRTLKMGHAVRDTTPPLPDPCDGVYDASADDCYSSYDVAGSVDCLSSLYAWQADCGAPIG